DDVRIEHSGGVYADLFCPGKQNVAHVLESANPAPDRKRNKNGLRHPSYYIEHNRTALTGCSDVIEHYLIGALFVVVTAHLHRVAYIDIVPEFDPLGSPAVPNIEARYNAFAEHGSPRFMKRRPSGRNCQAAASPACRSFRD